VSHLQRWGIIQEYVDLCRTHGYFTPEFYATAIAHMERIHVRRMLALYQQLSHEPQSSSNPLLNKKLWRHNVGI
jgi:hypothetical protein